eukprot:6335956-Ditylum_brightwellii.AAC.1
MEKVELKFKSNHDYMNNIPYVLEASNINVTSLAWAEKLNIDIPTGNKASNKTSANTTDQENEDNKNEYNN